jgi:very-short-patch-repair endonuclease
MKIYLAGKVRNGNRRGDNWRSSLVDDRWYTGDFGEAYGGGNGIDLDGICNELMPPAAWPVLPKAVLGIFDYVGPFLVSCDHGCFHSGDHATYCNWEPDPDDPGVEEWIPSIEVRRNQIISLCYNAMSNADIIFFWIDRLDCYGTLAELMIAADMKKDIRIATPDKANIDEMWFAIMYALKGDTDKIIVADTPEQALRSIIPSNTLEFSPIERMFWDEWKQAGNDSLVPQYEIPDTRYRVDFAVPDAKIAVELDGYEYHNDKDTFTKDRKRQRDLEMRGWRFIRFSGSEVYRNAAQCVQDTCTLINTYQVKE